MKKIVSLLLTLALLFAAPLNCAAVNDNTLAEKEASTARHLLSLPVPNVGSIGGEWLVIGLARSGRLTKELADCYYSNVISYVKTVGSAKLHRSKSTDNSRVILALTATGKDPRNVSGYDLLKPLADFNYVKKQGINGAIWALIALDAMQYEIPQDASVSSQTTREKLIGEIIWNQCSDGGWDLQNERFDPDVTGMALQALAPYYKSDPEVRAAVDKALALMSVLQKDSGDFSVYSSVTPESSAQIITALSALHIDCRTDSRFVKNGCNVIDSMMGFSVENGFAHSVNGGYNQMATEQAYYALVAYERLQKCKTSLYDMTDLITKGDVNQSGAATIDDVTAVQKYLAALIPLSLLQQKIADTDRDGIVDINDASALQMQLSVSKELQ